jgi:hypothetical protein
MMALVIMLQFGLWGWTRNARHASVPEQILNDRDTRTL